MASKPIKSIFDPEEADEKPAVKKKAGSAAKKAQRSKNASDGERAAHKYGRNQGEGLSREKAKYTAARYNKLFKTERYTRKSVQRDREYGMFWYDWLWHILRPVLCFACALLVVLGMVSIVWDRLYNGYIAPRDKSDETPKAFTIASGESVTKIGAHLVEEGYISSASLFKYYIQFYGLTNKLQSGVYGLSKSMDLFEVAAVLSSGQASNERTIRILPGWTVEDIADYLVEVGAIKDRNDFLRLCSNVMTDGKYLFKDYIDYSLALISANDRYDLTQRSYPLEGYLTPDTYRVYLTADAASILRTLIKQSDVVYNLLFAPEGGDETTQEELTVPTYGAKGIELSSDQIYILASVIQKEASTAEDMKRVSAVFYNRLAQGMRLQSDPTAKYLTGITSLALSRPEMQRRSPYNTYVIEGLPIGPICSPGRTALSAALEPDEQYLSENYLYFCATEPASGELVFAKTYEEHQANVDKYRPLWEEYDRQQAEKNKNK